MNNYKTSTITNLTQAAMKICTLIQKRAALFFILFLGFQLNSQTCPTGKAFITKILNSIAYATNSQLESNQDASPAAGSGSGHFGDAHLKNLYGGLMNFDANLVGPTSGTTASQVAWRNFMPDSEIFSTHTLLYRIFEKC